MEVPNSRHLLARNVPGNVAYGKPAEQTGVWYGLKADRAVDGRLWDQQASGSYGNDHCAGPYTANINYPVQWTIDLQYNHQLYNVTIYNTRDENGRIMYKMIKIISV